jgi:hypothetical protein
VLIADEPIVREPTGALMRIVLRAGCAGLASALLLVPALADAPSVPAPDWSCACLTYAGGTESCYFHVEIRGAVLDYAAFETSGLGPYRLRQIQTETIIRGDTRTRGSGTPARISIVLPNDGRPARIYFGETETGEPTFTARCTGTIRRR